MGFRVIQPAAAEANGSGFRVLVPAPDGKPKGKAPRGSVPYITGAMANLNRTLGIGDEIAAVGGTIMDIASGKARPTRDPATGKIAPLDIAGTFRENMGRQRQIEDEFAAERPADAALARGVGMSIAALAPGGAVRAPSSGISALAQGGVSGGLAAGAYSLVDRGTAEERLDTANRNIPMGAAGGAALGLFGYRLGERARRRADTDAEVAARLLRQRASADPAQMADEAADMRRVGVAPTALDVAGERGRRVVRATGVKTSTAGETLTKNAGTVSAGTKPAVMSRTRGLVDDPRTVAAYGDDLKRARDMAADTQYRQPYQTPVQIDAETASALRGDTGRAAIRRARKAAETRRDYMQMQELDSLLAQNIDEFPTVSAGTLDRIRRAMAGRGAKMNQSPDTRDIASGLFDRASSIDSQLENVEALAPARAAYKASTQAMNVADDTRRLDVFSTDPQDYAAWMQSLGPEARKANAMAIRQEILDALGGKKASTFGTLDDLATAPYVRPNLAEAIGEEAADAYIGNIAARLQQTRNATMVMPGAGSRTAVVENDLGDAVNDVFTGLNVAQQTGRGDLIGVARTVADWWRRRGVRPEQAEALARVAVDPDQLDDLIAAVRRMDGEEGVQSFLRTLARAANDAGPADPAVAAINRKVSAQLSRAAGVGAVAPQPREPAVEVSIPGRPELGVGRAY